MDDVLEMGGWLIRAHGELWTGRMLRDGGSSELLIWVTAWLGEWLEAARAGSLPP